MAIKESPEARTTGHAHEPKETSDFLPGTTFPREKATHGEHNGKVSQTETQARPGPIINGKPTTITLHASRDLKTAGLIPGIHDLINNAFAISHSRTHTLPADSPRLRSHDQLVKELSGKGTFTYVITYKDTKTVIGVASAKRYNETVPYKPATREDSKSAFTRYGASRPNTEGWELSSMAVDPSLQRQGLAGLCMELVEAEVKRRFLLERVERGMPELGLMMLLTTVKEINWNFYTKRGYAPDYETFYEPGWLGSEKGFTVAHMSKRVDL